MFKQLTLENAENLLASDDTIILDIRDTNSYHEAHIKNAMHMTMHDLPRFCIDTPKNNPIVVYCYHGISSKTVAQHLIEQGFQHVYSLLGGFETYHDQMMK
jgi:thiosulfate sulfurtransferase